MKGACEKCSSSKDTLKNGIERMLKYYIPEINSVENIETNTKLDNSVYRI